MFAKLNVQQKLIVLLMLPFIAVIMTSVPFAVGQINDAVAAGATTGVAQQARAVGSLVQDLQEERLLALAYLVSPDADQSAFRSRAASTSDQSANVLSLLTLPHDVKLQSAIGNLAALDTVRLSVVRRAISATQVYDIYHDVVARLIDALALNQQPDADATGLRQISTLDSLLRVNEDIGRVNAALVLSAADAKAAVKLATAANLLKTVDSDRFRQQAGPEQSTLLNLVEQGPTAQRTNQLIKRLNSGRSLSIRDAVAAAQSTISLTRVQQERIAHDIAVRAEERAGNASTAAGTIIAFAFLLVLVVIWLSITVSRSVAGPLHRLTIAAGTVADLATAELVQVADSEIEEARKPHLTAVEVQTADEIGELAAAFNRVQATAGQLMEQQIATRRNTAVMFANIARRTRSMVSRQLTFIDDLERNEQNERLLSKLYRLDHLTTRLHRSADSLLVVSGVREDERIVAPAPLAEVLRSAVAEIEGYQNVQVTPLPVVTIAPQLVPDLRLVLAELLENATAFSPPGSPVEASARVEGGYCEILVTDHGIGMTDDRLEIENRRLVERERLDVVPTTVLGLFVVGRLARRHGLEVQLSHTAEQGITATVRVPSELFTDGTRPMPVQPPMERQAKASAAPAEAPAPPKPERGTAESASGTAPKAKPKAEPERESRRASRREARREAKRAGRGEPAHAEPLMSEGPAPRPGDVAHRAPELDAPRGEDAPARSAAGPGAPASRPSGVVPPPAGQPPAVAETVVPEPALPPPVIPPEALLPPRSVPPPSAPPEPVAPSEPTPQAPEPLVVAPPAFDPASFEPPSPPVGPGRHAVPGRDAGDRDGLDEAGQPHRGLTRRKPGGHLPSFGFGDEELNSFPVGTRDALAERAELEAFARGTAQAAAAAARPGGLETDERMPTAEPTVRQQARPEAEPAAGDGSARPATGKPSAGEPAATTASADAGDASSAGPSDQSQQSRGGLTRRLPGTHLHESLRIAEPRTAPAKASSRDADAERAALDSFLDGLARAASAPDQAN